MAAKPARAVPPYLSSICWQCGRQASLYSESGYLSAASASHPRSVIRTLPTSKSLPPANVLRVSVMSPQFTSPATRGTHESVRGQERPRGNLR